MSFSAIVLPFSTDKAATYLSSLSYKIFAMSSVLIIVLMLVFSVVMQLFLIEIKSKKERKRLYLNADHNQLN